MKINIALIFLVFIICTTPSLSSDFEDDFDPPHPEWWHPFDAGWFFSGGEYVFNCGGNYYGRSYIENRVWEDCTVQAHFYSTIENYNQTGIMFRVQDDSYYYRFVYDAGENKISLIKRIPGQAPVLASITPSGIQEPVVWDLKVVM
ncbi:hypothetical protein K8T06_18365, partial [bacterium]|nr:hypothetical protein [bacterium]